MKHTVLIDDVQVNSYANLVLLNKVYSKMEQTRWRKARQEFLQEELKNKGSLRCFYCQKDNLKIEESKRQNKATVDHVVPKSNGGDKFSHTNFVVCCDSCNRRKGSMTSEEFLNSKYLKTKKNID
jgi:5-methylcytosine-specific restriction endonuclease McrA